MPKYQGGGLAAATEEEQAPITVAQDPATSGLLQLMAQQYQTTPEARAQAEEILAQYYGPDAYAAEEALLEQMRETAETSRQTYRDARTRLLEKEYDPRQDWFEFAAAMAAPTKTGGFGESLGAGAGAFAAGAGRRSAFERQQEADLMSLEGQLAGVDVNLLQNELALTKLRRGAEAGLAKSALGVLGKATPGAGRLSESARLLDQAYVGDYIEFTTGMSADAAKSLDELDEVVKVLRGGSDTLTGPIIGSITSIDIPYVGNVGKAIQDIVWPTGANVKEIVESTIQRSLRPILGAQFTEKEGERLIQRVYNPRLEEHINADRLDRLILSLRRGYMEKVRAAEYYAKNGTLFGYEGQVDWTIDDIWAADEGEGDGTPMKVRMSDGVIFEVPANTTQEEAQKLYEESQAGLEHGGPVGRSLYAGGGKVSKLLKSLKEDEAMYIKELKNPELHFEDIESFRHELSIVRRKIHAEERQKKAKGGKVKALVDKFKSMQKRMDEMDPKQYRGKIERKDYKKRMRQLMEQLEDLGYPAEELRVPLQEGGQVEADDIIDLEDLVSQANTQTDVYDIEELKGEVGTPVTDPEMMDVIMAASGAGLGYLGGGQGADVYSRLEEMASPSIPRPSGPERAILEAAEIGGEDIVETVGEVGRTRRLGVPATMQTAGGRGTRALGEQALIQGGVGAEEALEDITERHAEGRQRVSERVNKSLKPSPYFERFDQLQTELYENASPLYDKAYQAHLGISEKDIPALRQLMDTPDGQRAVKIALRLLRNQGMSIGKEDAVGLVRRPSLQFLDYVKRGFDQLIASEESMGSTTLGRSMRSLRTRLRDQLDAVAPEYAEARAQYAGDLEVLDALQSGREEFHRMQPEEVKVMFDEMTPAEKISYRTGVAQRLYERVDASAAADPNAARQVLGSPAQRAKLKVLFDKPSEWRIFEAALDREMKFFETTKKTARRGETGRQRKVSKALGQAADPMTDVRRTVGRPIGAVIRLFSSAPGLDLTEDQADEVIRILNSGDAAEIKGIADRFGSLQKRRAKVKGRRGKVALVGATVGALSLPFIRERTQ